MKIIVWINSLYIGREWYSMKKDELIQILKQSFVEIKIFNREVD